MLCRLPAHLGWVLWPPQQPGGGGPVLPLLPWEREAQTQTPGVQHGALPGQVIDCTAKLHRVFAHRVSPWIFSILCPAVTATSKSCRTTCTTHCLGMSLIKCSASSALPTLSASPFFFSISVGKAARGRPAPPPVAAASRVAPCLVWRRTCKESSPPRMSGSVCTHQRRPSCSPATPLTAPCGWRRSGRP